MTDVQPLETERLILRGFSEDDADGIMELLADESVSRFLPFFPPKNKDEARAFIRSRFLSGGRNYALFAKGEESLIGYVTLVEREPHDLGYALARRHWGRGFMAEACRAVIASLDKSEFPYLTATHDVNNPASGAVMKKLGMIYRYSYVEQWQPKNFPVVFRMYQLPFAGACETYMGYWDEHAEHFVEKTV